jgi:hypothetical protein
MYYGPYSIYSMGGMMQQQQQPNYSQQYFAPQANLYQNDEHPQSSKGKMSINNENIQEQDRAFSTLRGRPPKEKKRQAERFNALRFSQSIRQYLLARYD